MKKITLFFFSFFSFMLSYSQTYSTGLMTFNGSYSGQIDVTAATVTLTLNGPEDRWLGIGFNVSCMTSGNDDVVMFDGTNLTDRNYIGVGVVPASDGVSNQDWTITSNTTSGGNRTLIATRDRDTGDTNDFVFPLAEGGINFVWAYRSGSGFSLTSHGGNRGSIASGFTLGVEDLILSNFIISPNPVSTEFNIELPNRVESAKIQIFDVLGKQLISGEISKLNSTVEVSGLQSGVYMLRVINGNSSQTKRFIKQ